jgi:prepilin-type N-terminal cleavage/methylation domain-containing protein
MTRSPRHSVRPLRALRSGFSLVEVLIVIAVLGVMASIAINSLASHREAAEQTRNRRNAQEIVSLCVAAQAAGISFVVPGDPVQTARNAVSGAKATKGSFAGKTFRLPGMQEKEILGAAYYLDVQGNEVKYNGARPNP